MFDFKKSQVKLIITNLPHAHFYFPPDYVWISVLDVILLSWFPSFSCAEQRNHYLFCTEEIHFFLFLFLMPNAIEKSLTWFNNRMIFKKSCSFWRGRKMPIFHRLSSDGLKSMNLLRLAVKANHFINGNSTAAVFCLRISLPLKSVDFEKCRHCYNEMLIL